MRHLIAAVFEQKHVFGVAFKSLLISQGIVRKNYLLQILNGKMFTSCCVPPLAQGCIHGWGLGEVPGVG